MNRIDQCLTALKENNRKALISYIVSGDPHPDVTVEAMHTLVATGTDIIELGIPFSDPMAEGPIIQRAHERALAHHVSLTSSMALVKQFRETDDTTPVVLMGYFNPIERMGCDLFAKAAAEAGVDGVLTVDLPPEEATLLDQHLRRVELKTIFLVAPTTTVQRIREIVHLASGFIYYVSLKGVTGTGHLDFASIKDKLKVIRQHTQLPICVGFGIKDGHDAQAIAQYADGVVIGSVLVDAMGAVPHQNRQTLLDTVGQKISAIRHQLDQ